mgnify:FL=1
MNKKVIKGRREIVEAISKCEAVSLSAIPQEKAGETITELRGHVKHLINMLICDQEEIDLLTKLVKSYKEIEDVMRPHFKKQVSEAARVKSSSKDRIGWEVSSFAGDEAQVCSVFVSEETKDAIREELMGPTPTAEDSWDGDDSMDA